MQKIEDVGLNLKKYGNKKWSLNFHLHTASFFLYLSLPVSTLLSILQSLLAQYQLLLHKKSIFRAYAHISHIPYFYFAFSVLWSSPVEQSIKSEVLMTTTYHFYNGCHNILQGSWQDFVQFLCQTKKNSIDRIKEMVTKFSDKPKSQNTAFVYCTGL